MQWSACAAPKLRSRPRRKRRRRSRLPSSPRSRLWTAATAPRPRQLRNASGGGKGAVPGRMDEPVRRLLLALLGAVALTAERADDLADELADRGGMRRDDVEPGIRHQERRRDRRDRNQCDRQDEVE